MIEEFLKERGEALVQVNDRTTLAAWHQAFAERWGPRASRLACSANGVFGLDGDRQVRDDVGYLAVEAARPRKSSPYVLISVNPGWSEQTSRLQRPLMGQGPGDGSIDPERYEAFRRAAFPRWMNEVVSKVGRSRGAWWNNALNFLHRVAGLQPPGGMAELRPELDVIGWELWPMHSRRDGLTAAARRAPVLRDFAVASIDAALRMPSQAVVLASTAGFELVEGEMGDRFERLDGATIGGIRVARFRSRSTGRVLHAIRRQLFSGFGVPPRATTSALIRWVRGEEAGDVVEHERAAPDLPPLKVQGLQPSGPVLWLRHVTGHEDLKLSALDEDAPEEEVHRRIGGYWQLGLSGPRARPIRQALTDGRPVLVVGVAGARVVRVLEVVKEPDEPIEQIETTGVAVFRRQAVQPQALRWPGDSSARWGTRFKAVQGLEKSPIRVRLHTATLDDSSWIGRPVQGVKAIPQNPGLYSTEEELPGCRSSALFDDRGRG
ncbi:MAG: hypothetical protein H6739_04835 [Alphaproteobacteria bacterium]|nr:hypothetical protein [Alphaproteobacteria bacterium]